MTTTKLPVLTDEEIRTMCLQAGYTIKDGRIDLAGYVFAAARAIEQAVLERAGADAVLVRLMPEVLASLKYHGQDVSLVTDIERALKVTPAAAVADAQPVELQGVAEAIQEGDGFWQTCSGCHESNEGVPTGPFSAVLQCHLGNGCGECGGIGAVWDTTDYQAMADHMAASMNAAPQAGQLSDAVADDPEFVTQTTVRNWTAEDWCEFFERAPTVAALVRSQLVPTAAPQLSGDAGQAASIMQPIETIQYWAAAYADPKSGGHFMGHGMVATMLREYAALRASLVAQPSPQAQPADQLRDAAEGLLVEYRKRYTRATGGMRRDAPLLEQVTALNAALHSAARPSAKESFVTFQSLLRALQSAHVRVLGSAADGWTVKLPEAAQAQASGNAGEVAHIIKRWINHNNVLMDVDGCAAAIAASKGANHG